MKNTLVYVILFLSEIILGLTYGFLFRNVFPIEPYLAIAFLVPFIVLVFSSRKDNGKIRVRLLTILVVALLFAMECFLIFISVNNIKGEFIGEYEVIVEDRSGKGSGSAGFLSPHGTYEQVDLHDYRIIWTDEDDYVDVGDRIRVREYKGIFDMSFYVFVEEIH